MSATRAVPLARRARLRAGAIGLAAAILAGGLVAPRGGVRAADAPPTATPTLALSDRPPPGCCCFSAGAPRASRRCSDGLHEDKCRAAGSLFPKLTTTWTPGKCPSP